MEINLYEKLPIYHYNDGNLQKNIQTFEKVVESPFILHESA